MGVVLVLFLFAFLSVFLVGDIARKKSTIEMMRQDLRHVCTALDEYGHDTNPEICLNADGIPYNR